MFAAVARTGRRPSRLRARRKRSSGGADLYYAPVTDVDSTVFAIAADGVAKEVEIVALGEVQAIGIAHNTPHPEARALLETLAERLSDFGSEMETSTEYDALLYRGLLNRHVPASAAAPVPWPWEDLTPRDFLAHDQATATLTSEQVALVSDVPTGGKAYIAIERPNGSVAGLTVDPLLPDEAVAASE